MKKILIFYASYGGGHLNAAKSIYECILENYPKMEVELIDCMKYVNKAIEKVTTAAYIEAAKKMPIVWGRIYNDSQKGPLAHISSRSNKIMAIKLLKLLREKQPELIISTHPFGSQMCSYLKRKKKISAKIATIMTDFAIHDQWIVENEFTDYYFVAQEGMKEQLMQKNIPAEKIYVTGIPVSKRFLQQYDKNKIIKEFNLSEDKKTILFFGGGEFGLGKTRTFEIFEKFVQFAKNNNMQIVGISGKNEKMKLNFEEIVEKNDAQKNVKILEFTNQVSELMSISCLVVTKPGGMTTTESLVSHLPMVIINPIPGQEEENAKFLEENGIAIWLKKKDDVEHTIGTLLKSPEKLEKMRNQAKIFAHPNSTQDICKILIG